MEKESLFVGIGRVSVRFRHSRSLKDKRHSLKSVKQKLTNMGFSVSECGYQDNPKLGLLGYAIAGNQSGEVNKLLDSADDLILQELEVLQKDRDVMDYGFEKDEGVLEENLEEDDYSEYE
ncbi:MAG: DUF503 family protein [Bdellovibrionales bacterium]|nr:DUF503 family protein [Bdellovibrionales bacterium]